MISEILLLVKQVCSRAAEIDDFRASVPVLLQSRTFETVEGIRNALTAAHHAFVLVVAKRAFVANPHQSSRADIAIADGTFAIAFVAKTPDGYSWLFSAHDEIAVLSFSFALSQARREETHG